MKTRILAALFAAAMLAVSAVYAEEAPTQNPNTFSLGFGINSVSVDGQSWTRVNILPMIPVWQFKFAFDLEVFLDNTGQFSPKGWEFSDPYTIADSIFRKIYFISFGDKVSVVEDKTNFVYARFGALEGVRIGEGIIMDGYRNNLKYPIQKNLGLEFTVGNLTDLRFGLEGVINNFADFTSGGSVIGGRLFVSPLSPTKIPFIENLQFGVSCVADINQYAGTPIKTITNYVPLDAAQIQAISNTYLSVGISNFDANSLPPKRQTVYIGSNVNMFSMIGADFLLPIMPGFLAFYGQWAMNIDPTNVYDTKATEGWGFTAPGIRVGPKDIFEARLDYRMRSGAFQMNYFNSQYDSFRAVPITGTTNVTLKEDILDTQTNFTAGIFLSTKINLFLFYGYLAGEQLWDIRSFSNGQISKPVNPLNLEGRLYLNTNFVAQVPILKDYLKDATAYYIQNNVTNYADIFQPMPEAQLGFSASLKIGGTTAVVYSFQRTYSRVATNGVTYVQPNDLMSIGTETSF